MEMNAIELTDYAIELSLRSVASEISPAGDEAF
jgi:hypothetical protein